MTLKHAQDKNSNRKCRSTFYICELLQQLLSFNKKKKPTRLGKALKKSAGCMIFFKGAEMLDKERPSYADDGLWKGGLNTF